VVSARKSLFVTLLLAALPLSGFSQQSSPHQDAPGASAPALQPRPALPPGASTVARITVDVQVTDSAGRPVPGLTLSDFSTYDSGKAVKNLELSRAGSEPTEIIFLIDPLSADFEEISRTKQQIRNLVQKNGGKLPYAVSVAWLDLAPIKHARGQAPPARLISTGGPVETVVIPIDNNRASLHVLLASQDGMALGRAVDKADIYPPGILAAQGAQGREQRVRLSLQALDVVASAESERPGHKLVLWISPGWPLLAQNDDRGRRQLFNYVVAVNSELTQSRVTLFAIDPLGVSGQMNEYQSAPMNSGIASAESAANTALFNQGMIASSQEGSVTPTLFAPRNAQQVRANDVGLPALALQSGGQVLAKTNDIPSELAQCVAAAASFYKLSYDAPASTKANEYHGISVRVARPGLTVRTRAGYYGQPEVGH
jgi:VWFA-related protein